jgi:pilus assembly protein CpaB
MEVNSSRLRWILIAAVAAASAFLLFPKVAVFFHRTSFDAAEESPVLVAAHYIPAFTILKPDLAQVKTFPKDLVPPGALHAVEELQKQNGQPLLAAAIAIPEGQPLTRSLVTDAAQNNALESLIQPGKVAVSFEVDRSHGVGGWVRPGDTVAIFGVDSDKSTQLLFPSIVVLAVDTQRLGQNSEKPAESSGDSTSVDAPTSTESKVITVLATPTQASEIIAAREEGGVSLVLRSLGDDAPWPSLP